MFSPLSTYTFLISGANMTFAARSVSIMTIILALSTLCVRSYAQWSTDPNVNNAISTVIGNEQYPTIVGDGSGGAIITWLDSRAGTGDIYAQRINASGVLQWAANGVAILSGGAEQPIPSIASDGSGGAIITWNDYRSGTSDIYAQRVNTNGVIQWATDGVAISDADLAQYAQTIVSDGSGGAIITWVDFRNGNSDIYAQRINASGVVQWTANGVAISIAGNSQLNPRIVSDGIGGAVIAWPDFRNGNYDIYAQKINANGVVQWTADGVPISTASAQQNAPDVVSDGSGGAIITWMDYRGGFYDIYGQRINASGVIQWTTNGTAICTASDDQENPTATSDGSGGAFIAWRDNRSGNQDIYAQRINASGTTQWTTQGVVISATMFYAQSPKITGDGSDGAIITWRDPRVSTDGVYAQRISGSGAIQWTQNGVEISRVSNTTGTLGVVSDGSGGTIITWEDRRNVNRDIYAQRVRENGLLGADPPPILPLLWNNTAINFDAYRASTAFGSLPPDSSIIQGADDFFVPGGKTWTIDSIWVNGSFSVAFPTDSLVVAIYANTADKPGALLHRRALSGISSGGDVRRGLETPVTLTEGTYWFSVYGVYNTIQNIFWLWQAGTATSGREAHHQRFIGTTHYPWTPFSGVGFSSRSLFFSLYGSEDNAPVAYSRTNLNKAVPDNNPAGVYDTLTISGIPPGQVVQNIALRIDSLTHTWVGDFRMTLSHNGITRTLMNRPGTGANGSNGDNFIGTVLVDTATLRIDNITGDGTPLPGGPPYTGYFRPDSGGTPSIVPSSLAPFIGSDPNGDWVLFLSDNAAQDTGKIQRWSLLLQTGISTSVDPVNYTIPAVFTLEQNYPNPFNPATTIRFALPVPANVTLKIYNILGQEVATLVDEPQNPGTFNAIWNGRSSTGFTVASGVYFYQLVAKASASPEVFQSVKKMVLMK